MAARKMLVPLTLAGITIAAAPAPALVQRSIDELPNDLREAVVGATYGVVREGQDLRAPNPAQAMSSVFSAEGVRVSGTDETRGSWTVSLTLEAWGREGSMRAPQPAEPTARGRRVEYRRGALTEWYVNDARGLEQGFTIDTRPEGQGALEVALSLGSGVAAEIRSGGRDAVLTDRTRDMVLHYTGLRAWDAGQRELEVSLSAASGRLSIHVDDRQAIYPLHIDPWIAIEEAKLTASDAGFDDEFGASVSIDGDTAVVGAPSANNPIFNSGAAYVFVRTGSNWSEQQKLTPSVPGNSDKFGSSVAIFADTIVVGAPHPEEGPPGPQPPGVAYVFVRTGGVWLEQQKLEASEGFADDDQFGSSVAISGDTVVVGASRAVLEGPSGFGRTGAAYVFVRNGATWLQESKLVATDPMHNDWFGNSVGISADTTLIGARGRGSAIVFVRVGTDWMEQAELFPSDGLANFGESVAIDGDTALVGRPDALNGGSAYAFVRSGTTWSEQQKFGPIDPEDPFGESVAIEGDTAVIGSPDCCSNPGSKRSAYVFARNGAIWTEVLKIVSPAGNDDDFGFSAALSGTTALIGAYDDNHVQTGAGSAYVFHLSPPALNYCTAGTSASGCQALLSASGTASASAASGFSLLASTVEGAKDGLFFFGTGGQQANSWGNGTSYQCVVPPVVRAPLMTGAGTIGLCDGSFALDLNALWCPSCPKPGKNPGLGATVQAQLWYRDPLSTSNQTTSLSDAIEFVLAP